MKIIKRHCEEPRSGDAAIQVNNGSICFAYRSRLLRRAFALIAMTILFLPVPSSAKVCVKSAMTLDAIYNAMYPVGSIYISTVDKTPADLFGFGTWERFGDGRALVGVDESETEFDAAEKTGGAKTHTLIVAEMPSHTHIQNPHGHVIQVRGPAGGGRVSVSDGVYATGMYSDVVHQTTAINQNTGDGDAHNNLQPYITVYMWRRTS